MQRQDVTDNTPPNPPLKGPAVPLTTLMTSPPSGGDTMLVSDNQRVQGSNTQEKRYETTADGDVRTILIEPSFNTIEKDDGSRSQQHHVRNDPATMSPNLREGAPEDSTTPDRKVNQGHSRNLSDHFYDATSLNERGRYPTQHSTRLEDEEQLSPHVKTDFAGTKPSSSPVMNPGGASPSAGQKHHRGLSGEVLDPASIHRRMNSSGNSMPVDRSGSHQGYAPAPSAHHRKSSSGLDMLSAAAGVPKEELAAVAGARQPMGPTTSPWEPPSSEGQPPMSAPPAVTGGVYDYGRQGPAPPYHPLPSGYHHGGPPPPPPNTGSFYAPPYHPEGSWGYPPPAYHHHQRGMSQSPMYPVQYAPPRGADPFPKGRYYEPGPQQPMMAPPPSEKHPSMDERIDTGDRSYGNGNRPPPPHRQSSDGMTTGVQTFVTAIGVGEGNKTLHAAPTHRTAATNTGPSNDQRARVPSTVAHHQKMPSFGSLSTIMGSGVFPDHPQAGQKPSSLTGSYMQGPPGHHRKTSSNISFLLDERQQPPSAQSSGHHRSTSSSVSFLHCLEEGPLSNEAFLQSLAAQGPVPGAYPPPPPGSSASEYGYAPKQPQRQPQDPLARTLQPKVKGAAGRILASGGASKRVRRKCTIEGCPNRVVQGGLCIAHGAKRKQCKHPGCTKNVKKAGLCSTHGPARKRCATEGCHKVAVQGGRCIAHGAKKKLCSIGGCTKQAILAGMCKKHHDQKATASSGSTRRTAKSKSSGTSSTEAKAAASAQQQKPSHTRGLSIFQEISAESVQTLLSNDSTVSAMGPVSDDRARESRGSSGSYYM